MSARPTLRVVREAFPDPPARDTAVSHAILRRVSEGLDPPTLRIHRPGAVVAFGPLDRVTSGYPSAVAAATDLGFGAVQRLAGGRAAVFHEGTIAFSWAVPDPSPRVGIARRFRELAELMAAAFVRLGVDARVGEVPGEYCPGAWSVNARGRTKLMGVGQRLLQRASHVGGVVVVEGAERVRDVLVPVYRSLGLSWDPSTVGSVRDEAPGVSWEGAAGAILEEFAGGYELEEGVLPAESLALALELEPHHAVEPRPTLT